MNNSVLLQAAGEPRDWPLSAAASGTSLPASIPVPLTSAGGVFAAARPRLPDWARSATQQVTSKKYQEMARIAANGGDDSGSHPAWDPV